MNGRHLGSLRKQAVSRPGKIRVADPTTSRPHNTTDNYEQAGADTDSAKLKPICDELGWFHDEPCKFIDHQIGAKR